MVPYYSPDQGCELPNDGTAYGDECAVCRKRHSVRYIVGGQNYCGRHVPTARPAPAEGE